MARISGPPIAQCHYAVCHGVRTGFSKFYPVGRGLFEYTTHEEALAAIDAIMADYPSHSREARTLAGEYFAAERVLGALLAATGL
jgi:hypothetical protein